MKQKSLYTVPPKPGEPHQTTIDGKAVVWCGRCSKWGGHDMKQHHDMIAPTVQSNNNNNKSNNNSNGTVNETNENIIFLFLSLIFELN
jgi:ribosome-binding protein aMBF1 (putative translation factor)